MSPPPPGLRTVAETPRRPRVIRSPVLTRILVGTALAVMVAQLAGSARMIVAPRSPPLPVLQASADAAVSVLLSEVAEVPREQLAAAVAARAAAHGWSARIVPAGSSSEGRGPKGVPAPHARAVLPDGDVLWVDAPGWHAPSVARTVVAQILVAAAGVALVGLLLARPLALDLERVRATLARIGAEDLAARVGPLRTRDLAQVGRTLDAMAERLERLVTGQQQLFQAVSHELRTPHARVRFRLEQLAATDDRAARARIRDALERDLEQVEALLTELLVYARADVEPITLAEGPWDLGGWLVDVIDAADTLREGVDVSLHVEPGLPTPAVTRAHLARVVGNLIRNAQRHARARVDVRMTRDGPQHVALAVEDDGPGLPVGDRARLVQPFETGGDGTVPSDAPAPPMGARGPSGSANQPAAGAGVGLGLAIVSRIVERAGGTLTLDDAASGGARIVVRLPVRDMRA